VLLEVIYWWKCSFCELSEMSLGLLWACFFHIFFVLLKNLTKALNPGDTTLVPFFLAPSHPTIHSLNALSSLVHPHPHLVLFCFFPSSFNPYPHTSAHLWTSENWDTCGQGCSREKKKENFVDSDYIEVVSLALF